MNRGTEAVWPSEGGFTLMCDCGTITQVVVQLGEPAAAAPDGPPRIAHQELAVTCDGCGSAHWLTLTPSGELGPPR